MRERNVFTGVYLLTGLHFGPLIPGSFWGEGVVPYSLVTGPVQRPVSDPGRGGEEREMEG